LLGCTREQLEDRDFKEKELGEEWWYFQYDDGERVPFLGKHTRGTTNPVIKLTPRLLLQLLGTEAGREIIHPNIWVNALFADYKPTGDNLLEGEVRRVREEDLIYPKWIITDVRFPNEAKAIKDKGGIVIRVNRNNGTRAIDTNPHPSETALDDYDGFDYVVENDGSIEDLVDKIRQLNIV
jgi:hypothetical protein